ncbi:MAG: hypothetical protein KZQ83_10265 [gamma proteobacterium symbiont of Taylorina sp.]|nr:hypothetical protein [gamma proteobacterium symbiont of Taylorina sp.]
MHSFNESIRWVQAIIFQGKRVLSAHSDNTVSGGISDKSRVEEQFFLNACEKSVRWTESLSSEARNEQIRSFLPVKEIRDFRKSMNSTEIRNLREHEEEYLRTDGKSLEDNILDASSSSGVSLKVEPGITVVRNGDVLIGGIVSVRDLMQVAEHLNKKLVNAQHDYAKSKKPILNDCNVEDNPYVFAGQELK